MTPMGSAVIDAAGLQQLVTTLIDRGYRVVGPTVSNNAIVLAELSSADELHQGWGVDVGPEQYRLRRRDHDALFGHSAGPGRRQPHAGRRFVDLHVREGHSQP